MSETEAINIAGEEFRPGQSGTVEFSAGQMPSGDQVAITGHVFRAYKPGPTILFLGGVHGDEINGVEIIRRCLQLQLYKKLEAGTVIAIPLLNVYGFNAFSRDVPDGKDVNRSFPGSQSGSLASRIAHGLSKHVLPQCDIVIDFHTGGRGTYNYPQLRYSPGDDAAQDVAAAFAPPLIVESRAPAKSLRRHASKNLKIPVLTFEGGENLRYDAQSIEVGINGTRRLLAHLEMTAPLTEEPPTRLAVVTQSGWVRAGLAGLFQWTKRSGYPVRKGEPIGFIADPQGTKPNRRILSPRDGFIIGHTNAAVVSQGDALFHIGSAS